MNNTPQSPRNLNRLQTLRRSIKRQSEERDVIVRHLHRIGLSVRAIAEVDGRSHTTIQRIVTRKDS